MSESVAGAARPHDRYPSGRPGASPLGDRRGDQGLAADRWLTVIEDLPEEHTPNRALPQWAIDWLLFGMPKYASAAKIWGWMLSIAMSAQARGWTQMEFINEVAKTERRKNAIGQKRLTALLRAAAAVSTKKFLARRDLHLETVWRAIEPALSPR